MWVVAALFVVYFAHQPDHRLAHLIRLTSAQPAPDHRRRRGQPAEYLAKVMSYANYMPHREKVARTDAGLASELRLPSCGCAAASPSSATPTTT